MNLQKNLLKKIMHISCSLLVTLNIALSVINLFQLSSYSLDSLHTSMITFTSWFYLIFSSILLITGLLLPKKEKPLSLDGKKTKSLIRILSLFALTQGRLFYARGTMRIKRGWNITLIIVFTIFLVLADGFTAMVVTDARNFNMVQIISNFASNTYGLILTIQMFSWFLLLILGGIWQYIDTKERIQVPKDVMNQPMNSSDKIQCNSCSTIFQYDTYNGICPKCGAYNRLNQNTYSRENTYKRKKSAMELLKIVLAIFLIISLAIIATVIIEEKWNKKNRLSFDIDIPEINIPKVEPIDNLANDIPKVNIPEINVPEVEPSDGENLDTYFTTEEINVLLDEIKTKNDFDIVFHKEIYDNDLRNSLGERYHQVTIVIATKDSEKAFWFQYFKYQETTKEHKAGDIEFYMGAESDSITKSELMAN